MKKLGMQNDDLNAENSKLKSKVDALAVEIEKLNLELKENAMFRVELEPKLENANREIELNKSLLNMLNNEIQLLNSDKIQLEKKLLHSRRNSTPCVIVEEDEEDLEEEKRNDQLNEVNDSSNTNNNSSNNKLNVIHEEECDHEDLKREHDRDVEFIHEKKFNTSNTDGILILNKQIEDMTFYIDELKSELEAEREKNNEYANEIEECRGKMANFDKQNGSLSVESNEEIQRLNSELMDALFKLKEKTVEPTEEATDEKLTKCLTILKEELVEKENFNVLNMLINIDSSNERNFCELVEKFKLNMQQRDKRLSEEIEKVKYTEAQLEKIIKEFKQENESIEIRLNDKIHEHTSLKTQVGALD